jgi:hypothetical protein
VWTEGVVLGGAVNDGLKEMFAFRLDPGDPGDPGDVVSDALTY